MTIRATFATIRTIFSNKPVKITQLTSLGQCNFDLRGEIRRLRMVIGIVATILKTGSKCVFHTGRFLFAFPCVDILDGMGGRYEWILIALFYSNDK